MPLSCDCYPGCWAKHSESWDRLKSFNLERLRRLAIKNLSHGSYVVMEDYIRIETKEMTEQLVSLYPVTIQEITSANMSRVARWHSLDDWTPLEWAGAMAGEAGEACNAAKKLKWIETNIPNRNEKDRHLTDVKAASRKVGLEIADTIIYGVLFAARVGVDLEDCLIEAFNKKSEEYGFPERL